MPLLQTSGNVTADGYGGGVAAVPNYIEDVFSTYLYTGNGSTQTITNGIDLSTKGGLVWIKSRSSVNPSTLFDTARGATKYLFTTSTAAQGTAANTLTSFNTTGFSLGTDATIGTVNTSGDTYASWTFRKQPKFFDVVTYAGNGSGAGQTISHNLGSTPGCIIVKMYSGAAGPSWNVYHRSLSASYMLYLNSTSAASDRSGFGDYINNVTSTSFKVNSSSEELNGSGRSYVAYVFAHNAGGFGLTGTDNVISCGSFTTDGSGNATVTLGYEPQWVVIKNTTSPENWFLNDIMRGMPAPPSGSGTNVNLFPNTSAAESIQGYDTSPTATGFAARTGNPSQTYIYIAIRRGPMKVPTSGTSVFTPIARTGTQTNNTTVSGAGFAPDLVMAQNRAGITGNGDIFFDKLRGAGQYLNSASTGAEGSAGNSSLIGFTNDGFITNADATSGYINYATTYANWLLQRAPSFFDEVCYTGTGSATTQTHNLGVVPQLIIVKVRNDTESWTVYSEATGNTKILNLDKTNAQATGTQWNNTTPTSSVFSLGTSNSINGSGLNYVAYLFATCAGVSKVGSYTGNGSTQTINCGFTSGARFVLIKRTDATGDWYVYDTARGMTTLTDPYLRLNSTAAESATLGSVTTVSTGFAVNASILAAINTNGASYIFLAIA